METQVKDKGQAKVAITVSADKKPLFVAGNPVNAVSKAEAVKDEPKKDAEKPQVQAPQQPEQPKTEAAKADVKAGAVQDEPQKIVLNLEGTLKLVEELHRRKIQRDKLIETIDNLDSFEFDLKEEMDETGGNIYQGCVLTIEDDNRQKFTTKNPTIIWTVSQMVNRLCVDKLAEIEAGIILPAK